MADCILRLPAVVETVGFGKSTIYELIQRGVFPPPIPSDSRARGWRRSDIKRWVREQTTLRNADTRSAETLSGDMAEHAERREIEGGVSRDDVECATWRELPVWRPARPGPPPMRRPVRPAARWMRRARTSPGKGMRALRRIVQSRCTRRRHLARWSSGLAGQHLTDGDIALAFRDDMVFEDEEDDP